MLESSLIKLKVPRTATLLKRDSNTGFFLWNLRIFLRTPCLTEHLQWLLLPVSGFEPASLLKKRLQQKWFSVNFAKFLRTSFLLTEKNDWMTGWLLLVSICEIWEVFQNTFFIKYRWETAYFMYKLHISNHYCFITGAFQAFYTRQEVAIRSHSFT